MFFLLHEVKSLAVFFCIPWLLLLEIGSAFLEVGSLELMLIDVVLECR